MNKIEIITRFIALIITFALPLTTIMLDMIENDTEFKQCQRKRLENPDDF